MKTYTYVVLTNCAEGADEAFNRWYDDIHLPDILRIPGVVAARRSRLADKQTASVDDKLSVVSETDLPFRYLAVYKFETDDLHTLLKTIVERANTPEMVISDDLTDVHTMLYEDF